MIKVVIRHDPTLSKDKVLDLFQRHFGERYEVHATKLLGMDLVVKKSGSTGVSIKLVQKSDETFFRFGAFAPSVAFRFLLYGVIPYFILRRSWRAMEAEIKATIESEPAFR
jgi:hypothetical protein